MEARSVPSFEKLFEEASPDPRIDDVDFENGGRSVTAFLPMLDLSDPLKTSARKMQSLAKIVLSGKSLAAHTGYLKSLADQTEENVLATMTELEKQQYTVWSQGCATMPAVDWAVAREPVAVHNDVDVVERCEHYARALCEVYGKRTIDPQNAAWFASHMAFAMPLLYAVDKALSARRWQRARLGRRELELAELETCERIAALACQIKSHTEEGESGRPSKKLRRRITKSKKVLDDYSEALRRRTSEYKRRTMPSEKGSSRE